MLSPLRRHWFLAAYLAVLAAAFAWPWPGSTGGPLRLDAIKPWCIAGIFLCAGLALPTRRLAGALGDMRAHAVVQGVCFVLGPLLAVGLAWVGGHLGLSAAAQAGLIILGCLPTTIGSCVAITGLAGGNQGIPLVESVIGNLCGLILTPLLLVVLLDRNGAALPFGQVIMQLGLLAGVPVLLGQLVRARVGDGIDRRRASIGVASGALLLIVLLGIFSDLANQGLAHGVWLVAAVALTLHLGLLAVGWLLGSRSSRPDRIAIAITGSQKTAALGIPLIGLLFPSGTDQTLPLVLLPLTVYHIIQLVVGTMLASRLAPHRDPSGRR